MNIVNQDSSENATAAELKPRLQGLLDWLGQGLVEREQPIRLMLLAALAGEHLLLIGPPGTAKSELARRLHRLFSGGTYFERLLTLLNEREFDNGTQRLSTPLVTVTVRRGEQRRVVINWMRWVRLNRASST